jgi:DNA-binding response OmpR family regulator
MAQLLLVEDEAGLVLVLGDRLRAEGHDVSVERDGDLGLERACKHPFDLLILDVMLPRRSGFEVLSELRARGVSTPVLMLTARGQLQDRVKGLKLGADDYLVKPFEMAELLARVEARLRKPGVSGQPLAVWRRGELEVDLRRAEARRAGRRIELLPREFQLLRYLIDHPGALLSREELLDRVWGIRAPLQTRTVDVHVAALRRKLEDDPANPRLIVTVHGLGYRLEPT